MSLGAQDHFSGRRGRLQFAFVAQWPSAAEFLLPARSCIIQQKNAHRVASAPAVCKCSAVTEYNSPFPGSHSWPMFPCLRVSSVFMPALNLLSIATSAPLAFSQNNGGFFVSAYRFHTGFIPIPHGALPCGPRMRSSKSQFRCLLVRFGTFWCV